MDGVHDLGGLHGLGPIDPEPEAEEPWFHHEWERRIFALNLACGAHGRWSIDDGRYARERQHPVDYLRNSYYQTWLAGLSTLLVERGLLSAEELASGKAGAPADPATLRVLRADAVEPAMMRGTPYTREVDAPAVFKPGDTVRVKNRHPVTHTRAPRYARGRVGVIDTDHGIHVYPDSNAAGGGEDPQHLYSVRFAARELWGPDAPAADEVFIDLWDDHLEPS